MKTFQYTITDEVGIHARPAGNLVKEAKKYASRITVTCAEKTADATGLLSLMGLGVKKNTEVTVQVEGEDEEQAAAAIEAFFRENL